MVELRLVTRWAQDLNALARRIGAFVPRAEPRLRVGRFLQGTLAGTLAGARRRNGWQLAEAAAEATPYGMQRLVASAAWDAEAVRDDLRAYVHETLGASDGILIVAETGLLKKGTKSAGVQRQYSGTAGRIENCQLGVFLAYATTRGHAFVDSRPRSSNPPAPRPTNSRTCITSAGKWRPRLTNSRRTSAGRSACCAARRRTSCTKRRGAFC